MQSTSELSGLLNSRTRAARAMLAEKGARPWSAAEQATFDVLMDDAEGAQQQLQRMSSGADAAVNLVNQHREAFATWLRKSEREYTAADRQQIQNTMSTTTAAEGGNAVSPMVAAEFVDTLKGYGWMRQVAASITTASGANMGYPSSDGSAETGEALAQNAAASSLDPSFGTRALNTSKVGSKIFTVPMELLQDSQIDITAMVLSRARARIGRVQNVQFTTGTGTGEPTGLVTAASVGKTGTTGQTLTIIYDDMVDMIDSIDEAALGMPDTQAAEPITLSGWMFSQTMRKVVRKVKDTTGRPIWTPGYDAHADTAVPALSELLDYPVFINNDMPAPGANAKSLAFGNLRSYMIRDAVALTMYRFQDSAYVTKGQIGFLAIARAGGNLLDTTAVKLYQHSAT
ncbi:MAG: hypothetical protein RIQ60_2614 [Pseudomonadota bacterium]|jgi:HK97 family phage major capsid protein